QLLWQVVAPLSKVQCPDRHDMELVQAWPTSSSPRGSHEPRPFTFNTQTVSSPHWSLVLQLLGSQRPSLHSPERHWLPAVQRGPQSPPLHAQLAEPAVGIHS